MLTFQEQNHESGTNRLQVSYFPVVGSKGVVRFKISSSDKFAKISALSRGGTLHLNTRKQRKCNNFGNMLQISKNMSKFASEKLKSNN